MLTADVADRWTIDLQKFIRCPDDPVLAQNVKTYLAELMRSHVSPEALIELLAANARVWALESEIRQGKEGQLGLEEVGRRALKIREHNAERIAVKNKIAVDAAEPIESKIQHLSQNVGIGGIRAPDISIYGKAGGV